MANGKRVLTPSQRKQLREHVDKAGSARKLAEQIGIGGEPVTRALAGLVVRSGTLLAIEHFLEENK